MRLLNAVFLVTLNLRNSKIDKIKDIAEVDATGRYIAPVGVREDYVLMHTWWVNNIPSAWVSQFCFVYFVGFLRT